MDNDYNSNNKALDEYRINKVQTFGYLIGIDPADQEIKFYSENVVELFYLGTRNLIGFSIHDLYNFRLDIPQILALNMGEYYNSSININHVKYHVRSHYFNSYIYIEIEEYIGVDNQYVDYYSNILNASTSDENWTLLINSVKDLTGFDRVLIYQLLESYNGGGVILYDSIEDQEQSIVGLKFPEFKAHDRDFEIHSKAKSTLITDLFGEKVPIISINDEVVDLTYTEIRSKSDAYIDYLKESGASVHYTISIHNNDKLWGLVIAVNIEDKKIPFLIRQQCELLTKLASLVQLNFKSQTNLITQTNFKNIAVKLKESILLDLNLKKSIENNYLEILALTSADGIALVNHEEHYMKGITPDIHEILRIKDWASHHKVDALFYSDSFKLDYGDALDLSHLSAGIMISFLDERKDNFIIWFKKENIQTVYLKDGVGHPASEENRLYQLQNLRRQEIRGRSTEWKKDEVLYAAEMITMIDKTFEVKSSKISSLYQELKNINEELESFSYTVSHDLRTPLTVMKLNCQMVQRSLTDNPNVSNRLSVNVEEIDRMSNMMKEILSLSKASNVDISLKEINPLSIIEKLVSDIKIYYNADATTIEIRDINTVLADEILIYEVLQNIIGNAIKYSSNAESPHIVITSHISGSRVVYRVSDNGIGIKEADRDKMFKLFSRMSNTDNIEGNGVGLSVAQRMMKKMHAEITYESTVDVGTTFILTFLKPE